MSDAPLEDNEAEPALADRLSRARAVPSAGFRGALGRHLAARDPGYPPRPRHLWPMVTAYASAGLGLMLFGLLQATGVL